MKQEKNATRTHTNTSRQLKAGGQGKNSHFTGCGLDCFLRGILLFLLLGSRFAPTARTRTHPRWAPLAAYVRQPGSQLTACHRHRPPPSPIPPPPHHHRRRRRRLLPLPLPPTDTSRGGVITSRLRGRTPEINTRNKCTTFFRVKNKLRFVTKKKTTCVCFRSLSLHLKCLESFECERVASYSLLLFSSK